MILYPVNDASQTEGQVRKSMRVGPHDLPTDVYLQLCMRRDMQEAFTPRDTALAAAWPERVAYTPV